MSTVSDLTEKKDFLINSIANFANEAITAVESLEAENQELRDQLTPKVPIKWGMAYGDNASVTDISARLGGLTGTRRFRAGNEADLLKAIAQIKADAPYGFTVISFKANDTWANMAAGKQDTWLKSAFDRLNQAGQTFNVKVYVSFNHEPENDANMTDLKRDDWTAMQKHLADIFASEHIYYGCILMGYHSMPSVASNGGRWLLENCIPDNVTFVFFDYYEKRGRNVKNSNPPKEETGRTAWTTVFKVLADFCQPRAMEYGLAETGISQRGYTALPGWFDNMFNAMQVSGATVFQYFNTKTNDGQPAPETCWLMDEKREAGYKGALARVHEYNA